MQGLLQEWGVDTSIPGRICQFSYMESAVSDYLRHHGGTRPAPHLVARHVRSLDALAPTLAASHSNHPILLGERPSFLGARGLLSKQGIPPSDVLHRELERARPRTVLLAMGRGVHFLAASAVLHLVMTEDISPLRLRRDWRCATAFTGGDTFSVALRAHVPAHRMLAASEVPPPAYRPWVPSSPRP